MNILLNISGEYISFSEIETITTIRSDNPDYIPTFNAAGITIPGNDAVPYTEKLCVVFKSGREKYLACTMREFETILRDQMNSFNVL